MMKLEMMFIIAWILQYVVNCLFVTLGYNIITSCEGQARRSGFSIVQKFVFCCGQFLLNLDFFHPPGGSYVDAPRRPSGVEYVEMFLYA